MKNNKRYKNLLNSVSNGGKLDGALNKIYEEFIKEITDKIDSFKSEKDKLENKIRQSLDRQLKIISEREKRVKEIEEFLSNTNLNDYENLKNDYNKALKKIQEINVQLAEGKKFPEKISGAVTNGLLYISQKCKTMFDQINEKYGKIQEEIRAKEQSLRYIQKEIKEQRNNLDSQVKIWRESIEQDFDSLSKGNALFMENEGPKLFAKYIRDNAYEVFLNLVLGFFRKSKKKL